MWLTSSPGCLSGRDFFPLCAHTLLIVRTGTYLCVCFNAPIEISCFLFSPSFPAYCCHGFFRNLNRERVTSLFLSACASARFLPIIPIKGGTAQDQKVCWAQSLTRGCRYVKVQIHEVAPLDSFTLHCLLLQWY